jgi:hypothetical protein
MRTTTLALVLPLTIALAACTGEAGSGTGEGGSGGSASSQAGAGGTGGHLSNGGTTGTGGTGTAGTGGRGGSGAAGSGVAGSGSAGSGSAGSGSAGSGSAGSTGSAGSGSPGSTGSAGSGSAGSGSAGTTGSAGSGSAGSTGVAGNAGNPNGSCSTGIPAGGQPVNTSSATPAVGSGTAASCTFAALQTAVTAGGIITFNCGSAPVTITVTATLNLPTNKDTVIDGGNKITLDGGNAVRILSWNGNNFQANNARLTLQHITLTNGKATPTMMIPTAPAPCSQGWTDGEGGALRMNDGNLTVIDSIFTNNHAVLLGPDAGGGAIKISASKNGALIVGSTFTGNQASNAGAVGALFAALNIYNSLFTNNTALGHDANSNDPTRCSVINAGQNEVGSGGNGGAIYSDGNDAPVLLCGDAILNNHAGTNAFGGGLFFTSNNYGGTLTIQDTTMTGNIGGSWTNVQSGTVKNAGTAVGTNCKSITLSNSTLQGV